MCGCQNSWVECGKRPANGEQFLACDASSRPRCFNIFSIDWVFNALAMIFTLPPHFTHFLKSEFVAQRQTYQEEKYQREKTLAIDDHANRQVLGNCFTIERRQVIRTHRSAPV